MKSHTFKLAFCFFVALCCGGVFLTGCGESVQADDGSTEQLAAEQQTALAQLIDEVQIAFGDTPLPFDESNIADVDELLTRRSTLAGRKYRESFDGFISAQLVYGYVKMNKDSVGSTLVEEKRTAFYDAKEVAQDARANWMKARETAGLVIWDDPGFWDSINPF